VKILVLNNAAPFIRGGAEALADELVRQLNAVNGVESEQLRIPFQWIPSERLIEEILIARSLRLQNVDRVIALKFPAYLIEHPNKTLWLLHQYRQAYDLGDAGQGLGTGERDMTLKRAITAADNRAFAACRSIYVNSPVTHARLKHYNGVDSTILYPPVNDEHLFAGGQSQGYIFAGGRVAPGKRQHLLVEAMALRGPGPRLIIAGPPDSEAYAQSLRDLVAQHRLEDQVDLIFGFHPREQIAAWVNGAMACAYLPYDEDAHGYVTQEAFVAGKAVLTVRDAGGVLDIVNDETGVVAEPEVRSLAEGLAELSSEATAARKGAAARALYNGRGITWAETIEKLLS